MTRLTIELNQSWVLSHRNAGQLPTSAIAQALQERGLNVSTSGFTKVLVDLPAGVTLDQIRALVAQKLAQQYQLPPQELDQVASFREELVEEKPQELDQPIPIHDNAKNAPAEPAPTKIAMEPEAQPQVSALERIQGLLGAEELAKLCNSISKMAPMLRDRDLRHIVTNRCFLFSVDDGYGLTTALELLGQLYNELGLMKLTGKPVEYKLDPENPRGDPLKELMNELSRATNKLVCIDIRNWMDKTATPEFRDFLTRVHRCQDRLLLVFRVPYLEREALQRIDAALSDVLLVDTVSFVPLDQDKLQALAQKQLERYGFTATEEAWDLFRQRLAEEKSDGRFYGTKTARNVVDEMTFLKFNSMLESGQEDRQITAADLRGMVQGGSDISAAERLERMVGVEKIRDRIYEIVSQIEFARKNQGVNAPAMHMRFVGNPGTGKTTVARIVGQLLKERNILSRGYFFEHNGGDFLGMYVGHTAPKTLALCRDAYGSVLFIDEAYTLADANYGEQGGYAKEAIDTLIAQMENHRQDLVVIMAGYPKEMARLMDLNPGLAGRMPYELVFPNYSPEELAKIFHRMMEGDGFTCAREVTEAIDAYFAKLDKAVLEDKHFANARFVRNLFERTWSKTVMRAQLDGSDPKVITLADFQSASGEDARTMGTKQTKHSRPGYRLGLV